MWRDGGEENIRDILSAECSVTPALPPVTSLIIENNLVVYVYNGKWENKFLGHCVVYIGKYLHFQIKDIFENKLNEEAQ